MFTEINTAVVVMGWRREGKLSVKDGEVVRKVFVN